MLSTISLLKNNLGDVLALLKDIKRQQTSLRVDLMQTNVRIRHVTDLVNGQRQNKIITLDKHFVPPKTQLGSISLIRVFNDNCNNTTYCEQMVSYLF